MLSMDPFGWDDGPEDSHLARALRGPVEVNAFKAKDPGEALKESGSGTRELELAMFAGQPIYLARESPSRSLVIPVDGSARLLFDTKRIAGILAQAVRPYKLAEVRVVNRYESYYVDRHHRKPLPVLAVQLNDSGGSLFYIDLKTARIVASYARISRWNRWLYHGLHSFDLPWLYGHRPIWDLVVLSLMLGGTALSFTSVLIAWQRLRHKIRSTYRPVEAKQAVEAK